MMKRFFQQLFHNYKIVTNGERFAVRRGWIGYEYLDNGTFTLTETDYWWMAESNIFRRASFATRSEAQERLARYPQKPVVHPTWEVVK